MQNRESLQKILLKSGLSEHESSVYLAMLELGPSTILKISRQAEVKRTTIYAVIEALKAKGLVGIEERAFKQVFVAENPSRLERILEEQKNALKSSFPELQALYSLQSSDSIIRYYVGVEVMRSVYDELLLELRDGDDYFVLGDPDRWDFFDKDYFKTFIEKRLKTSIKAKIALIPSSKAQEYKKTEKNFNEEVRILPEGTHFDANMTITPRKIIIHPLTHPITTMIIETPTVVKMQQSLFEVVWDSLQND